MFSSRSSNFETSLTNYSKSECEEVSTFGESDWISNNDANRMVLDFTYSSNPVTQGELQIQDESLSINQVEYKNFVFLVDSMPIDFVCDVP
jgi:hypothetical protein